MWKKTLKITDTFPKQDLDNIVLCLKCNYKADVDVFQMFVKKVQLDHAWETLNIPAGVICWLKLQHENIANKNDFFESIH